MYNSRVIDYSVDYAPELNEEFDVLDAEEFVLVDTFLGALAHDYALREGLANNRFSHIVDDPRFDTQPIGAALKLGFNLSRVKLWKTNGKVLDFRLIYALHHSPGRCKIVFLGLMPRGDDYDQQSSFGLRIHQRYVELGVSRIPRS